MARHQYVMNIHTHIHMYTYIETHTHTYTHTYHTDFVLPSCSLELLILGWKMVTSARPAAGFCLRQTHPGFRSKYLGIEAKPEVKACSYHIGTPVALCMVTDGQTKRAPPKEYSDFVSWVPRTWAEVRLKLSNFQGALEERASLGFKIQELTIV